MNSGTARPPDEHDVRSPLTAEIIEPARYQPSADLVDRQGRYHLLLGVAAVLGSCALLVFWFLFTARSVSFSVAPEPAEVMVQARLHFQLRGVHLLRSGTYAVTASAPGYEPFAGSIVVADKRNQVIPLQLTPLPGLVTVRSDPPGAQVALEGELLGVTPLIDAVLPAGPTTIVLQKPRYQPVTQTFEVRGKQERQEQSVPLPPDWANVSLVSEPPGAQILIDNEPTTVTTPGTVEVLAGEHELQLQLAGYETYRRRIIAAAQEPMQIEDIKLNRADARLQVNSQPGNVGIVLNGVFQGQAPLALALKSGTDYRLRAFKAGYRDATSEFRLHAGEARNLNLNLQQLLGTLVIRTQPAAANVYVNDTLQTTTVDGQSGSVTLTLPTRPQRIEIKLPGYAGYRTTLTPKSGLSQELRVKLLTEAEARLAALQPRVTAGNGQELVLIQPTESFTQGASRREPGRRANEPLITVTLKRLYYLSTQEVTNAQYRLFSSGHDSGVFEDQKLNKDEQPVVSVSWIDAALYCNWLSEKDGLPPFYRIKQGALLGIDPRSTGYRLPTEAEWGYAALQVANAELPLRFPWGPRLPPPDRQGNYADRSASHLVGRIVFEYNDNYIVSAPVGSFSANTIGLFDMGGNVAEWAHDFYEIPKVTELMDPIGPVEGEYHVIKGASWMHGTITDLRLAYRDYGTDGREDVGFRIARYAEAP